MSALDQQISEFKGRVVYLYEDRDHLQLTHLLQSVSPMAAILLNFEIGKANANFIEEGYILSLTLLPHLNKVWDYGFLGDDLSNLVSRYIASLILHIKDTKLEVEKGFMLFVMRFNPSLLSDIIEVKGNR